MAYLKPLPLEVFLKLKEEIDRTHINEELIEEIKKKFEKTRNENS